MNTTSVKDKIITARVSLLLNRPFFGTLASRLIVKETNDEWCKTAATDGRHIYYNAEFFSKMSVKQIEFVIAHEILHNVFDHFGRREHRDPKIYNIAADFCVNGQLIRDNIGKVPDLKIFHDTKFYDKSSEEIYDILIEQSKTMSLDELGEMLDSHIDGSGQDGQPKMSKEERDRIRDELKEAIIQAAQSVGAGHVPSSVARLINEWTTSRLNWRELLRQQIQSTVKCDFSFARPNRKSQHLSAVLPGSNYDETIDICVALDMSGSISNEQAMEFLGEVYGIMEEYRGFKVKIFCFDTKVYNEADYDEYSMDEFMNYEPMGGGGTDFNCMWDYMVEQDYVPKRLVCITDMCPNSTWCPSGMEEYCPVLWIGHGTTTIVPPFGEYAYFDE